jgi:hypothetical protein
VKKLRISKKYKRENGNKKKSLQTQKEEACQINIKSKTQFKKILVVHQKRLHALYFLMNNSELIKNEVTKFIHTFRPELKTYIRTYIQLKNQ